MKEQMNEGMKPLRQLKCDDWFFRYVVLLESQDSVFQGTTLRSPLQITVHSKYPHLAFLGQWPLTAMVVIRLVLLPHQKKSNQVVFNFASKLPLMKPLILIIMMPPWWDASSWLHRTSSFLKAVSCSIAPLLLWWPCDACPAGLLSVQLEWPRIRIDNGKISFSLAKWVTLLKAMMYSTPKGSSLELKTEKSVQWTSFLRISLEEGQICYSSIC